MNTLHEWFSKSRPRRPPVPSVQQRPVVGYHLHREDLTIPPETEGIAYDYLFGSDGVFLAARSPLLYVRIPIAECHIRGLQPVGSAMWLVHGKISGDLWDEVMVHLDEAKNASCEKMVAITCDDSGYRLVVPEQHDEAWSVKYTPADNWLFEVHSHRELPARFSPTDTHDEQGLRLYGVVGRLDQHVPQVQIRLGVYGHFLPVLWSTVFDGDHSAIDDVNTFPELEDILKGLHL